MGVFVFVYIGVCVCELHIVALPHSRAPHSLLLTRALLAARSHSQSRRSRWSSRVVGASAVTAVVVMAVVLMMMAHIISGMRRTTAEMLSQCIVISGLAKDRLNKRLAWVAAVW